jgi:hypothetical protein
MIQQQISGGNMHVRANIDLSGKIQINKKKKMHVNGKMIKNNMDLMQP